MKGGYEDFIFWHIRPCIPLKLNRHFGGIFPFLLQDQRVRTPTSNLRLIPAPCWFLHVLFFDHEDGDDIFIRNIVQIVTNYTALYPRR